MPRIYTRVWFWIVAPIVLLIVFVAVWLLLPLRHPQVPGFTAPEAMGFVYTRVDLDSEGATLIVDELRSRLLGDQPSGFMSWGFGVGSRMLAPKSVALWLAPENGETVPGFLAVVSFGRAGRIARAFGKGILADRLFGENARSRRAYWSGVRYTSAAESSLAPAAFAFKKDTLLVSSSLDLLESALANPTRSLPDGAFAGSVRDSVAHLDGLAFVGDNSAGVLTPLVRTAEEKFAFSIMPSVDALSAVVIGGRIRDGALTGSAEFRYDDADRLAEGRSDVRFLYGIIRRLLRPRGLDMDADIIVDGLSVRFDFTVPDIAKALESESSEGE